MSEKTTPRSCSYCKQSRYNIEYKRVECKYSGEQYPMQHRNTNLDCKWFDKRNIQLMTNALPIVGLVFGCVLATVAIIFAIIFVSAIFS